MKNEMVNPFVGYELKWREQYKNASKNFHPVHEIVRVYMELNGKNPDDRYIYTGRSHYPKLAREAKLLLEDCGGNLEDALWSLDKMSYKAWKGGFNWSISTCRKHELTK